MRYNVYFKDRLIKKNVDGEEVRLFMLRLHRDEVQYVRLERIREEDSYDREEI